jgi:DNA-nicking Smr family endonuclease
MPHRKKPSAEEIDLFRRSVGPVRKVAQDRAGPVRKSPAPRPRRRDDDEARIDTDNFSDAFSMDTVSSDETLFFARPGLQQRQLQRLRRGQLQVGAELDMHGMTATIARNALVNFISLCSEQHVRCARIIHGKGYGSGADAPVLKNRLNSWLRQHHDVLAFSSAQIKDGGSGALYVLLRSSR